MRINILFKRINKLNYAINEDILREPLDETSENIEIKNDFSYISDIEESRILVTVTTSIESKRGDREFRRLDIEIDVLLELLDYSDVYNEKDIIDRVHEKYEPLHKIIIDNITNSLTSLDDLPKI
ncbi:MAG: hypothetical protein E7E08_00445 [Streptococcus mitis]|jgi:hypothetical protein|nr:hypothetical protein [Streptococcus mitis]